MYWRFLAKDEIFKTTVNSSKKQTFQCRALTGLASLSGWFFRKKIVFTDDFVAGSLRLFLGRFWEAFWWPNSIWKAFGNGVEDMSELRSHSDHILISFWIPFSASHGGCKPKLSPLEAFFAWSSCLEWSGGFSKWVSRRFWMLYDSILMLFCSSNLCDVVSCRVVSCRVVCCCGVL